MEGEMQMSTSVQTGAVTKVKKPRVRWNFKKTWPLHLMLVPGVIFTLIFAYLPMGGIVMAFQDFKPWLGFTKSEWVGWEHFQYMFERPDSIQVIWNTLLIASLKIVFQLLAPFLFALLLNEVRHMGFKRTVQTLVYLPHFLSWVILGGILLDMLSPEGGLINKGLIALGIEPVFFLGNGNWFRFTVIISDVWKEFGYGTIVFLASLAGINPALYEAAEVDGATRWKQTLYITIPALMPITIVLGTLSLGNILNAGFDQIFNLYNPLVYSKGDIIDTFVYRMAILNGEMSFGTAVGLFKSFVAMFLIISAYRIAYKYANYRIF
jgi:putative aldouronate transport system permease protein